MRQAPVIRAVALSMLVAVSVGAQRGPADKHLALVRPLFSGERAYETVAFLDKFARRAVLFVTNWNNRNLFWREPERESSNKVLR